MAVTLTDYFNHLETSDTFQHIAKIELLNRDETSVSNGVFTGRITGGSLNVSRNNGVRRTCTLILINHDQTLNPSPDIFWVSSKFALYLGFRINGEDFYIKQGIFVLENPSLRLDGSNWVLTISGQDKWSLLDSALGGRLLATTQILVDTDINAAVEQVLALPEINDPKRDALIADPTIEVTFYDIFAEDKVASTVLLELNSMVSRNIYYDANGNPNFRDDIDDTVKPSLYDFGETGDRFYLGGTYTFPFTDVYNTVIVVGDNINGAIFSYTAENNNDASPISIDRIGRKIAPEINDSNIYTTPLAKLRAEYELKQVSRLITQVQFNSYLMFHLDVDNVCTITDINAKLDHEQVLINSYSINFGSNPSMSINATRTQELLFDFDS
jgi:hypothetical protein